MSFFIKKRQNNGPKHSSQKAKKRKTVTKQSKSEEITSSEDEDNILENVNGETIQTSSEDENETAQEKKIRLAKLYLQEIQKEEKARLENDEVDQSVVSKRLKEEYLKETGRLKVTVAERYKSVKTESIKTLKYKRQKNTVTCICLSQNNEFLYSGSLDGVVLKYSLVDFKYLGIIPFIRENSENNNKPTGFSCAVLSIALSSDNKFLAVGQKNGCISIWNPSELTHIKTLTGHKKSVFGVSFKKDSYVLYSCGEDRIVKVWSLEEMAFVESLFGHQEPITSMDALHRDRVVTSGGRNLRLWKIPEESQLVYNGHSGNIDNIRLINEETFVTSGDDGQICIWSILRKKPLQSINAAHGVDPFNDQPHWITSVAALVNTDLIASGSYDGFVRLWKLENNFKTSKELLKINVNGVVNALAFTSDGKQLIVAVGRDYRLGRWIAVKEAKNCILCIPFNLKS